MFKEIAEDFKEYYVWFQNSLFYRRHAIKLNLACRLANMKQKAYNKRYYVILCETPKGDKLVSINNVDFKRLKRKKWLPKHMTYLDLQSTSFYATDLRMNNKTQKEERQKAKEKYLRYAKKYMKGARI